MSNRVDFFQSAEKNISLPAGRLEVVVDGAACPYLETIELVAEGWPEFSRARLLYNASACGGDIIDSEDVENILPAGKAIRIEQVYHNCPADTGLDRIVLLAGNIDSIETSISHKGQRVEVIVRDFSAAAERIKVYGRWVHNHGNSEEDNGGVFFAGLDSVFNESNMPNAFLNKTIDNSKSEAVFAAESNTAKYWGYAEVIDYLLGRFLPEGQLHRPGIERLRALTGNKKSPELDVNGLTVLGALRKCCRQIGVEFRFAVRDLQAGAQQAIVFYKSGQGRKVELNLQYDGQLSVSKTDIIKLESSKKPLPVTNKYVGTGGFKTYEATFELIKAWDASLENSDRDKFSPSSNSDFYLVKDVYRKWCLNEAGHYTNDPYNRGDAFDFSEIFDGDTFVYRRRRFKQAISCDKLGQSLGYYLEVSYDNGGNWQKYGHEFRNLSDECGVWLSSDTLDDDQWSAAQAGTLQFRTTASVESDQRLNCRLADGPVNSTAIVVEQLIGLADRFGYRKVSGKSIFYKDNSLGQPDEKDDNQSLYEYVLNESQANAEVIETIDVQTSQLAAYYQPSDIVTHSPDSRDVTGRRKDNRSVFQITRVCSDFVNQRTKLQIIRQRRVVRW